MEPSAKNIFKSSLLDSCPACDSRKIHPWRRKERDGVQFRLWKCSTCGTGFMNPQPSEHYLEFIYSQAGHGIKKKTSATIEEILAGEAEYPNATVDARRMVVQARLLLGDPVNPARPLKALDIGSGYGFYSQAAIKAGFQVTAINPGAWENDIFEKINGIKPIAQLFDAIDFGDEKFDLVIMSHVLEHMHNPWQVLLRIESLLNSHGVIAIAVPNINSLLVNLLGTRDNSCLLVPDHLMYFSYRGIQILLERAHYNVMKHSYISRIPYALVSNKLNLTGISRSLMNFSVKWSQKLPIKIIDFMGVGFSHNIWGQKRS